MEDRTFILYFYTPIIVWLVLIVLLFAFLLARYTFGKWTNENPNPYSKETLGLPRGIFRAVLTLTLLFGAVIFELIHMKLGRPESHMEEFMVAFQMMIAFYFGSKVMHHVASNDRKKTVEKAHQAVEVAKVGSIGTPYPSFNAAASSPSPASNNDAGGEFYDPESEG